MSFDNYTEPKAVSKKLKNQVLEKSKEYIAPPTTKVLFKYLGVFILSIFLSLMICPQNGVGLLRSQFPIYHLIFHNNMLLCGLYCGFIFFATTHLVSFYILNHFERIVIFKKIGYLPLLCMSLFFTFSMTPLFAEIDFSILYTVGWLGVVILAIFTHKKLYLSKFG